MKKSNFIRCVIFLLLTAMLIYGLCDLFQYENNHIRERFNTYDDFEKNTVDVTFIGTSAIDRYYIAAKGFEESGIAAYPFTSEATPAWLYISMLKQATKNQSPKLVIFDMRPFLRSYEKNNVSDIASRRVIDSLDFFSLSRFSAINKTLEVLSEYDEDISRFDMSYFFSFIKYHNMWENSMSFDELKQPYSSYLGFYINNTLSIKSVAGIKANAADDERESLDELCQAQLFELLDYVSDKDYEILFLDTAHVYTDTEIKRRNTLCDILEEKGIKYVINELEADMYDFESDFYNDRHVNYYGAEKFTSWFQDYLKENYDLPDRRQDEKYELWYGAYDNIKNKIARLESKK